MSKDLIWLSWFGSLLTIVALVIVWLRWRQSLRADTIRYYRFPTGLFKNLCAKYPGLSIKDCQLVEQALRQYFLTYLHGGFQMVSMPSQVTDDLWHEFILCTKDYDKFCHAAFGRFLHHTPATALGSVDAQNIGLRRCWRLACREEGIHPKNPTRLPLLFAIDAKLNIPGGFRYLTDCTKSGQYDKDGSPVHCANEMGTGCSFGIGDGFNTSGDNGCGGGD
jgi:hypothetical protein